MSAMLGLPILKNWIKCLVYQDNLNATMKAKAQGKIEEDAIYFRHMRNKFKGRRGFVIGNGPSLKLEDLERLNSEITIASNKIFLAFDQISWRPTYHTIADPLLWEKVKPVLHHYFDVTHLPSYLNPQGAQIPTRWYRELGGIGEMAIDVNKQRRIYFSDNLSLGAFGGRTVTMHNLQFAVHLGINPIYIIGCDHYYKGEKDVTTGIPVVVGQEQNHFTKNYREPGEIVESAPIEIMNKAFYEAYKFSMANSVRILNATRGGFLEIFPRVDFDSLF